MQQCMLALLRLLCAMPELHNPRCQAQQRLEPHLLAMVRCGPAVTLLARVSMRLRCPSDVAR
jgi:hypothetical protein